MKRIAFFVEGQTEQIFVIRLLTEVLGKNNLSIISKHVVGGTSVPKREMIKKVSISRQPEYMALIYDCGSDNRVKSVILENLQTLKDRGYEAIVGLRDLYPLPIEELPQLKKGLDFLPRELRRYTHTPYKILIAVREVEAWFLAETHHYAKVNPRLTSPYIKKKLHFSPFDIDITTRTHPAEDLNNIYRLVGKSYTKKRWQVEKLMRQLDFRNLQHNVRYDVSALGELFTIIEKFKTS